MRRTQCASAYLKVTIVTESVHKHAIEDAGKEELTRFTTTSASDIFHHLRMLVNHGDPVTIFSNHGRSFMVSRLLGVDHKSCCLYFSQSGNSEANRQLLNSERTVFTCSPGGVKTQFLLTDVTAVDYDGQMAFMAPLPNEVTKLQRREYFRIQMPAGIPVTCTLYDYQGGAAITLQVYDISLGGLSLVLNARIPGFEIGTIYNRCELDLREYGIIPLVLKIRNQLVTRTTSGAEQRRVGTEFIDLESRAQTLVQRYIAQLERERRAMASSRDD